MSASIENKIRKLPVDMQRETEDFVDFLLEKASNGTEGPVRERKLGLMRGTVNYMAPDFDAPLEIFHEHMGIITKDEKITCYEVEPQW